MVRSMNNRQKLEAFYAASIKNDRTAAEAVMHPEFTVYEPAGLPYGGTYKGKAIPPFAAPGPM
jgi:ketosteroid isomerase-like protein